MNNENIEICKDIYTYYGVESQYRKLKEEIEELANENARDTEYPDIEMIDEMADVYIMLCQHYYNMPVFRDQVRLKVERQIDRIKKGDDYVKKNITR